MNLLLLLVFVVLGYLVGTIPTGYLISRWRGVDIRRVGSGNIGATNVLRAVGPVAALVVLVVDPLKGVLAVALPSQLGMDPWIVAATAFATVAGNTFNVMLRFRGGKGVATTFGVFLVIDATVALLAILLFAITLWIARYVSLASVVAVSSGPLLLLARGEAPPSRMLLAFAVALLILWSHRDNIARLQAGNERRLGDRGPSGHGPPGEGSPGHEPPGHEPPGDEPLGDDSAARGHPRDGPGAGRLPLAEAVDDTATTEASRDEPHDGSRGESR
jgi:acyl phosphate:glycerol-3-phosphate acyltransferase